MGRRYPFVVVHGRFQPFHREHLAYCRQALDWGDTLIVGITNFDPALVEVESANPQRHMLAANPFSYWERTLMVRDALLDDGIPASHFATVALPIHHPERWQYYVPVNPDDTLYIIRVFSDWEEEKVKRLVKAGYRVKAVRGMPKLTSATEVRRRLAATEDWAMLVPDAVRKWIERLNGVERMEHLCPVEQEV